MRPAKLYERLCNNLWFVESFRFRACIGGLQGHFVYINLIYN